jgi:MFS family permease
MSASSPRSSAAGPALRGAAQLLRALRHRNYRLFFGGQGISLIGTWMQRIAVQWLVYRLTGSAVVLGVVAFASQIATFALSPIAGVLADRWNLRRALLWTQILALVQAAILALLAVTNVITIWEVVVLSLLLGIINAFDMPVRHAFVVEMVEGPEDLGNAIALNSSLVNAARLVGPSLAGVLITVLGEGWVFTLNALSYVAVVLALLAMTMPHQPRPPSNAPLLHGLREGLAYAAGFPPIRALLLLLAVTSLLGLPYATLMPIFAADILGGGPHTLGFLFGASGLGALAATVYLAWRSSVVGLGRAVIVGTGAFGLSLLAFAYSQTIWLSLLSMLLAGFGMLLELAATNTILQSIVDDDKRGRIMSLYSMAFLGMAPFGSLAAGGLAHAIGAPNTLALGGCGCLVGTILFALRWPSMRSLVRPIYVRKGLLVEDSPHP